MSPSSRHYVPVEGHEDEDLLHGQHLSRRHSAKRHAFRHYLPYITHGTLFLLWVISTVLWIRATRYQSLKLPYSPANSAIEYYEELQTFQGTINVTSIYRAPPSPEVDAAWIRVSVGVPSLRITKDELLKLGVEDTPSKVRYREEDGGGYKGALEVTHQLHCLDVLRKYVHLDYYSQVDPFFKAEPETYTFHLDHCIDILRQVLMCSADVGIITFDWVKGYPGPYPNFNTKHQCRNLQKVISWGVTNAAKVPGNHVMRLEGEVDLAEEP